MPRTHALPPAATSSRSLFVDAYRADAMERVRLLKTGLPVSFLEDVARRMSMPKERLIATLGLASATVHRKARNHLPFSTDEGTRVLGIARLVGQVETMVMESGEGDGFDAGQWVSGWLEEPLPALAGRRPAEFMDTPDGQSLVAGIIAQLQSGAYS